MNEKETNQLARDLFNIIKQMGSLRPIVSPLNEGITRSELELLAFLSINQRKDNQLFSSSEISNMLSITPAAVTHMINPLEKLGFVERVPDENDRRLVLIRLTREGGKAADIVIDQFKTNLSGFISFLGKEEAAAFVQIMQKLLNYFSLVSENPEI